MSKQKQKFKFDLKTILTLIVLAAALVLGVFNGWQDAEDKGAAAVPAQVQEVADYIFEHGELPERFITKREAEKLGWDSSENYVSDVAPGKAIGGDRLGNYEGLLPDKNGRTWYVGVFNGWQDAEDKGAATVPAQVQEVADYIFEHGELPERFITKREAEKLGWDSSENYVSDVAPGKAIGGDRFGNREGLLPDKSGRTWYEADVNYESGNRGAERIVYSSDGLVYYTADHYESFTEVKPSK